MGAIVQASRMRWILKLSLTVLTSLSVSILIAQPTLEIDPDNLPGILFQDHWTFEADEIMFHVPTGVMSQYYNFSDVDFELTGPLRTWKVASEASKYEHFPDATLCYTQSELSRERFFRLDADSNFVEIGSYYSDEGTDIFEFLDDPSVVSLSTASLGVGITDTISARLIIDGDTSTYQNIFEKSMISWGAVRTPARIYANCLIQEVRLLDTLGNTHRLSYNYFYENLHNRIFHVALRNYPSEEILYMIYQTSEREPVLVSDIGRSIKNISLSGRQLTIETNLDETLHLTLFDLSGKVVFQSAETITTGDNQIFLPVNLVPAYYFLLLVDDDGNFHVEKLFATGY
jgi:hypothetical protein